jgi:hypothetical protein
MFAVLLASSIEASAFPLGQVGAKFNDSGILLSAKSMQVGASGFCGGYGGGEGRAELATAESETVLPVSNPGQNVSEIPRREWYRNFAYAYKELKPEIYLLAFVAGWGCYGWKIRHSGLKR